MDVFQPYRTRRMAADLLSTLLPLRHGGPPVTIDLQSGTAVVRAPLPPLRFLYKARPATVVNNGHAVQAAFGNGPSLALEAAGQRFELLELHFHTPSEHLVNGQAAPMEVHLSMPARPAHSPWSGS